VRASRYVFPQDIAKYMADGQDKNRTLQYISEILLKHAHHVSHDNWRGLPISPPNLSRELTLQTDHSVTIRAEPKLGVLVPSWTFLRKCTRSDRVSRRLRFEFRDVDIGYCIKVFYRLGSVHMHSVGIQSIMIS
jgi:hypothetical protein